jgi:hypothetical protein
LATTALLYQQIAAIAWRNDQMNVSAFIDNLSDVTLGYISIPLVLLLIAAREPARGRLPAAAGAG